MKEKLSLYIHIPFCASKCPYCDFNSFAERDREEDKYFEALKKELYLFINQENINPKDYILHTIYFGGGTPSIVRESLISDLLNHIKSIFNFKKNIEITLEANPESVTRRKLIAYKNAGVTRISLGIQSLNDDELKTLGRPHNAAKARKAIENTKDVFNNFSIDLIYGINKQTLVSFEKSIEEAFKFNVPHISLYSLTIEESTPYYNIYKKGILKRINTDLEKEMLATAVKRFKKQGLIRYEISNFALKGLESKHNSSYWQDISYIGIGVGAHSYVKNSDLNNNNFGRRYETEKNLDKYFKFLDNNKAPYISEDLTKEDKRLEHIYLSLRQKQGLNKKAFFSIFKETIEDNKEVQNLINQEFLRDTKNTIKATVKGMDFLDEIIVKI